LLKSSSEWLGLLEINDLDDLIKYDLAIIKKESIAIINNNSNNDSM
jgi:hypothetical protein